MTTRKTHTTTEDTAAAAAALDAGMKRVFDSLSKLPDAISPIWRSAWGQYRAFAEGGETHTLEQFLVSVLHLVAASSNEGVITEPARVFMQRVIERYNQEQRKYFEGLQILHDLSVSDPKVEKSESKPESKGVKVVIDEDATTIEAGKAILTALRLLKKECAKRNLDFTTMLMVADRDNK